MHFTQKFKMAAKKRQESDFCDKSPVDSADTLWVLQNFGEIALSCTVSKINALLWFTQKFKMLLKVAGKRFLRKNASRLCIYPVGQKFHQNCSHRFRDKCAFAFYTEIQDGRQKWWKGDFCLWSPVDSSYTLRAKTSI